MLSPSGLMVDQNGFVLLFGLAGPRDRLLTLSFGAAFVAAAPGPHRSRR
jgi:hypothetical protein